MQHKLMRSTFKISRRPTSRLPLRLERPVLRRNTAEGGGDGRGEESPSFRGLPPLLLDRGEGRGEESIFSRFMKSLSSLPARYFATFLTGLLLFCSLREAVAQCSGEAIWQSASTNWTRCGVPGYVTNDTYYSVQVIEYWRWKAPSD